MLYSPRMLAVLRAALLAIGLAVGMWASPAVADGPSLTLPGPAASLGQVMDLSTRSPISPTALAQRLADADIVALGEIHDNPDHHAWQAWLVAELDRVRGVDGLAVEMFFAADDALIAEHRAAGRPTAALGEALDWEARGWPDWSFFAPILDAAPTARIIGGGFKPADLRALAQDVSAWPEADRYGLTTPLPAGEQAAREAEQIAAHCDKLPASMAPMMVGVQRLWDASFAEAALTARGEGGLAALIVGTAHARNDRGAPAAIKRVAPALTVVSVGVAEVEAGATAVDLDDAPYDFLVLTGRPEREDPCAAFDK